MIPKLEVLKSSDFISFDTLLTLFYGISQVLSYRILQSLHFLPEVLLFIKQVYQLTSGSFTFHDSFAFLEGGTGNVPDKFHYLEICSYNTIMSPTIFLCVLFNVLIFTIIVEFWNFFILIVTFIM